MLNDGEVRGVDFSKLSQCSDLQRLLVHGCTSPSPHSFTGVKLWAARNVQVKMWVPVVNRLFYLLSSHLIYLVNESQFFERGSLHYVYFICVYIYACSLRYVYFTHTV